MIPASAPVLPAALLLLGITSAARGDWPDSYAVIGGEARWWATTPIPDQWLEKSGGWFVNYSDPWLAGSLPHAAAAKGAAKDAETIPFAANVSAVRVLGGWGSKAHAPEPDGDVAVAGASPGELTYRWGLFDQRLDRFVAAGVVPSPLVLDNVPFCFVAKPDMENFGQSQAPDDPALFGTFIEQLVRHVVARYGAGEAGRWRWRVGTEPDGPRYGPRWSQGDVLAAVRVYAEAYDHVTAAVRRVLPAADVGPGNFMYASHADTQQALEAFADHVRAGTNNATGGTGAPVSFVALSNYAKSDTQGRATPEGMREFVDAGVALRGRMGLPTSTPVEVHEWGWLDRGGWGRGVGPAGAYGGAWRLAALLWMRAAGAGRVFHWHDAIDVGLGADHRLLTGFGWVAAALEQTAGPADGVGWAAAGHSGVAVRARPPAAATGYNVTEGAVRVSQPGPCVLFYLAVCFSPDPASAEACQLRAAVTPGDAPYLWDSGACSAGGRVSVEMCELNASTSAHDAMLRDLEDGGGYDAGLLASDAGLLASDAGQAKEVGALATAKGKQVLQQGASTYLAQNRASLRMQPFRGTVSSSAAKIEVAVELRAPAAVLIRVVPSKGASGVARS